MSSKHLRAAACTIVVSLAVGGSAVAAQAADTTISVSPRVLIAVPDASPVDFAGVSKVRKGKPLPRGWVVVRRRAAFSPSVASVRPARPGCARASAMGALAHGGIVVAPELGSI